MSITRILRRSAVLVPLGAALSFAAAAQSVTSFTVVNADTDTDIATFQNVGSVSIASTPRINVRANTANTAKVVFSGSAGGRTESSAPFALKGDNAGNYIAWAPAAGTYTITATPFSSSGVVGQPVTLTLTVDLQVVSQPAVSSFTIVNADTGAEIATVSSTGTVSMTSFPRINVRANANAQTLSVVLQEGSTTATDSGLPFSLKGDSNGVYAPWSPSPGTYAITATPYSAAGGAGLAGPQAQLMLTVTSGTSAFSGRLMIDPENPRFFVYDRDDNNDGVRDPAYLAGSGGPEGFLYLDDARKQDIVNRLLRQPSGLKPVNGLYFHALRSFGGDAANDDSQAPFLNVTDPYSGIDPAKIANWRTYLKQLDDAGVVSWFNLFDDSAIPYGCEFNADYDNYAKAIVNAFKDLKHLVWVTQEEYRWEQQGKPRINCSQAANDTRQIRLAASIRAADPHHPIATHHMGSQAFAFPNDTNIRVFAQQTTVRSPEAMHDTAGKQGWGVNGSWVYVMAEAHSWHKDLLNDAVKPDNNGAARALMRRSHWATAMSGGSVMMYDAFEGNEGDPPETVLDDLRRLRKFMESTPFNRMAPLFDTALTNRKLDGTKYMLVNDAAGQYILYADAAATKLGLKGAPSASYELKWYDPATGAEVTTSGTVDGIGNGSFTKPAGIGNEVAVFVRKL